MTLPIWSVVAMVDEPAPLVAAFAQHMLAIGAQRVDLFLDAPNPRAVELMADHPACRITLCDAAFWAASEAASRPVTNSDRQYVVAGIAARRSEADWILHCDVDEFLRKPDRLLTDLSSTPDEVTHVSLRMAERVHLGRPSGLFGGAFRKMHADYDNLGPAVHGDLSGHFHCGLSGHMMGKSFMRTRRGMRPTIHYAVPETEDGYQLGRPGPYLTGTRMLHFDGLTPLHYAIKIMRRVLDPRSNAPRVMAPGRTAQIERISAKVGDPAALARYVMRMTALTPRQEALLRERNLLEDMPFRPQTDATVARLLSPAVIDDRLRARHKGLLERHAPGLLDEARWLDLVAAASAEDEVGRAEL